jgi:hypothetical protein
MLKLKKIAVEPVWLDAGAIEPDAAAIPGFRIKVLPVTVAMILAARAAGSEAFRKATIGESENRQVETNIAFSRAIAHLGIVEWEGVVGEASEPAPLTLEALDAALDDWRVFDFVDKYYVAPALMREDEKNVSAPSPGGTGGAKTPAKGTASTARSRARTARTK